MKRGELNKILVTSLVAASVMAPVGLSDSSDDVSAAESSKKSTVNDKKLRKQAGVSTKTDLQQQTEALDKVTQQEDATSQAYVDPGEFTGISTKSSKTLQKHAVDFSQFIFLSDTDYLSDKKYSYAGYGSIMKNTNPAGSPIRLLIDGKETTFSKGMGLHASGSLVYDISEYTGQYTNLSVYAGVDYSRKGTNTDGVKFKVSVSNDLDAGWKVIKQTDKLMPTNDAVHIQADVSGYKYLKLETDKSGNNYNDHAVYADLRLVKAGYDITQEQSYTGLKTVAEYDAILAENTPEYNYEHHQDLILQRELVNRLGYNNIMTLSKTLDGVSQALEWLKNDTESLRLLIEAGNFFNGNGYNATVALGRLYKEHKADLDNEVYKKMILATVAAYSKNIKTFLVNYGGNAEISDPVVKYEKFKWLYENDRFVRKAEFESYPMELVRYVMDAKMDDSEIIWLSDKLEKDYPDRTSSRRLSGYTYVRYVNTGYNKAEFYDANNLEKWDAQYDFTRYGISYGKTNLYHLWMLMQAGGICWGISGIGMNQAEVQGIPSVNTYQPGHEAYLVYKQNAQKQGLWEIWTNIGGWKSSYSRWGSTTETQARLLLGWGCMEFNKFNTNNTTYILLAQAALNNYDKYKESLIYSLLANSYTAGSERQKEAYNKSLEKLSINLDSLYGLIKAYKADQKTTQEQWLELAQRIIDEYTYYPAPMVDLLALITPHLTSDTAKAQVDILKQAALNKASQATAKESLQADACREIAKSLLGKTVGELASFSFDGENAGKIVLNKAYDNYEIMTRVSLDGGKTWETFDNGGTQEAYTPEHVITLTKEQLSRINAQDDIVVGLVGTEATTTINIENGQAVSGVYLNDDENLLLGNTTNLEYSTDNGQTWNKYDGSLTSQTRITGNTVAKFRRLATGVYLQGPESEFSFKENTDPQTSQYVPLQNVTVADFTSEETKSANNAAINFIDGNGNTAWHTKWNVQANDKFYAVKFDTVRYINKLTYKPSGQNGRLQKGNVYVSMDGKNWTFVKFFEGIPNADGVKTIDLGQSVPARYVKLEATGTYGLNNRANWFFSGTMLSFYEDATQEYDSQARIEYSTTDWTNQDVTATLVLPIDCTTTEAKEYTFSQNGSHTFTYQEADGTEKTIQADVSWIDKEKPTATITYSTTAPTNGNVVATLGDFSEEGITITSAGGATHEFSENGSFTFEFVDKAGNKGTAIAKVNNIDRDAPVLGVSFDRTSATNQAVTATLNPLEDGAVILGDGLSSHTFTENGTWTFKVRDAAGNIAELPITVDWIDKEQPIGELSYSQTSWTADDVVVSLDNLSKEVTFLDGSNGQYTFTKNGSYDFIIQDKAGNISTYTAKVDWIDKTKPTEDQMVINLEEGTQAKLNINDQAIEVLEVNGQSANNTYTMAQNGTYTYKLRMKDTGYTFDYTVQVDNLVKESQTEKTSSTEDTAGVQEETTKTTTQDVSGEQSTTTDLTQLPIVTNQQTTQQSQTNEFVSSKDAVKISQKPQNTKETLATTKAKETTTKQAAKKKASQGKTKATPAKLTMAGISLATLVAGLVLFLKRKL